MARKVKEQEYSNKRNEILSVLQRLVYTKGYERIAIGDILADLKISNGAFYHYFDSKSAVLEALVERMQQEAEQPLIPIIQDSNLPALEKFQHFFTSLDNSRASQRTFLAKLLHIWFADENAIIRQKVDEAIIKRRAPLLTLIIRQGIQEGVFSTPYPEQMGGVILSLTLGMGNTLAKLFLLFEKEQDTLRFINEIVATYAAYMDAIESTLGVTTHFLHRPNADTVREWLLPLKK
jgi:AcrR family transcriptional regulator